MVAVVAAPVVPAAVQAARHRHSPQWGTAPWPSTAAVLASRAPVRPEHWPRFHWPAYRSNAAHVCSSSDGAYR